jgi:hypothetical protein
MPSLFGSPVGLGLELNQGYYYVVVSEHQKTCKNAKMHEICLFKMLDP